MHLATRVAWDISPRYCVPFRRRPRGKRAAKSNSDRGPAGRVSPSQTLALENFILRTDSPRASARVFQIPEAQVHLPLPRRGNDACPSRRLPIASLLATIDKPRAGRRCPPHAGRVTLCGLTYISSYPIAHGPRRGVQVSNQAINSHRSATYTITYLTAALRVCRNTVSERTNKCRSKGDSQYDVPTSIDDRLCSWSSSNNSWSLCHVSCRRRKKRSTSSQPAHAATAAICMYLVCLHNGEKVAISFWAAKATPACRSYLLEFQSALPDRGGDRGWVGGMRREHYLFTHARQPDETNGRPDWDAGDIPSVSGGIHGSTEYGRLSSSAQMPRIAECSARSASA